jgi:hypothetical protein
MIFVRISINHDTGALAGVIAQDTPFHLGGRIDLDGAQCQLMDLGCLDDTPGHAASHVRERIEAHIADLRGLTPAEIAAAAGLRMLPVKCSLAGIRQQLRERGAKALPMRVRAWLTLTLPDETVRALGPIWEGVPLSALASMERLRNRRDPQGGSRIEVIEREIQRRSDARSARALARRKANEAAAADSAWQDMLNSIGARDGQAVA